MKDDKKIIKFMGLVMGIMTIVTVMGLSFAYFTTRIEESDSYSLKGKAKSGGYDIGFIENVEGITIENTYPMPNEMGLKLDPYTFTVTNNEPTSKISVDVIIEVADNSTLSDDLINVSIGEEIITLNPDLSVSPSETTFKSAYKIFTFSLNPNESKTFDLHTWMNENGTIENAQNKTWSSRVLIVPNEPILTESEKTLKTLNLVSNGVKNNFDDPATTDEGVFEMEDDYGTSYYYRGAVENNYVKFAGFYWRIIRVNGDGSLRIMYDGTQAYANGANDANRFIKTGQTYNTNYNDAKYVGWMYGPAGTGASTSKAQAQTNTADSTIKGVVDAWYKTNIEDASYGNAVSDTLFCNDRSTPGKESTGWSGDTGLGYGINYTAYGAYARTRVGFSGYTGATPTFKCLQKNDAFTVNDTNKGNGALTYPVGLITADEIVAAGAGKYATTNTSYYLYRGSSYFYWSLSPYGFDGAGSIVFDVNTFGQLINDGVGGSGAVAPVINLSAEYVKTLRGTGTMTDPYQTA